MILKPKYRKISQKEYCCVPACLSMVMNRNGIKHGSQEKIGQSLGLIVPQKDLYLFKTKVMTGKQPWAGYGTQVNEKEYSINNYFLTEGIPLQEKYYSATEIKDCKKFVTKNLKLNNDMMVCFNYKKLYGSGGDGGHVSLLEEIDGDFVVLVEPEKNLLNRRKVKLVELVRAMKHHGKSKQGGFWLISKK